MSELLGFAFGATSSLFLFCPDLLNAPPQFPDGALAIKGWPAQSFRLSEKTQETALLFLFFHLPRQSAFWESSLLQKLCRIPIMTEIQEPAKDAHESAEKFEISPALASAIDPKE